MQEVRQSMYISPTMMSTNSIFIKVGKV